MFTGIVTGIGTVTASEDRGDRRVTVRAGADLSDVAIGASIACSGACMTVVEKGPDWFAVDVSGESVSKTARGMWDAGARLNLERALKVGDELGGHIVTGHVDGVGEVVEVREDGGSHRVSILTVNEVSDADGTAFGVNIIPHTWAVTTLGALEPGRQVNVEIDVLARYLKRMRDIAM